MVFNVAIIGAGCAGLTAAIYCARALLSPIVFAGDLENKGGLLSKTSIVENYPGFPDGINGYDLVENMEKQAVKYGATIVNSTVNDICFDNKYFNLVDDLGDAYLAKTVIICTGSKPNKLGLPDEDNLWSKGISSCAVCDGALYRGKKIIVVGGGDTAAEHSLFLTKFSDVTLIHRSEQFRASKIMQDRVKENPKIKIIYDTVIDELSGDEKLESITCRNIKTGKKFFMRVDGLFYGLGLKPETNIFKDYIETDQDGYIKRNDFDEKYKTMTSVQGIFVAGDCHDKKYKQAVTACSEGCKAALDVINYLSENQ